MKWEYAVIGVLLLLALAAIGAVYVLGRREISRLLSRLVQLESDLYEVRRDAEAQSVVREKLTKWLLLRLPQDDNARYALEKHTPSVPAQSSGPPRERTVTRADPIVMPPSGAEPA